jgi:hypothetical protein
MISARSAGAVTLAPFLRPAPGLAPPRPIPRFFPIRRPMKSGTFDMRPLNSGCSCRMTHDHLSPASIFAAFRWTSEQTNAISPGSVHPVLLTYLWGAARGGEAAQATRASARRRGFIVSAPVAIGALLSLRNELLGKGARPNRCSWGMLRLPAHIQPDCYRFAVLLEDCRSLGAEFARPRKSFLLFWL